MSLVTILNRYLFTYRNSVHVITGFSPLSMVFKHKTGNRLNNARNNDDVLKKKIDNYPGKREERFVVGERVLCRDYRSPNKKGYV